MKGMKIFRTIYYSILGLLVIALIALSCVDIAGTKTASAFDTAKAVGYVTDMTTANSGSIFDEDAHAARVKYISSKLDNFGVTETIVTESEKDKKYTTEDVTAPSYAVAKMRMTAQERYEWTKIYTGKTPDTFFTDVILTDIVVYLPANGTAPTSDVVLMTAHYDSVMMGPGANDGLSGVGALLEVINETVASGVKHNNDLMFVFTDGEEEGVYGARLLQQKFKGFSEAYSRTGFAANFESRGSNGTVLLTQSSSNNYNLIQNWGKIKSTEFASSIADLTHSKMPHYTDFVIFGEIPSLNFANVGGSEVYHTQNDSVPNSTVINNHGSMALGLLDAFGSTDLTQLKGDKGTVYFSYLDAPIVAYSYTVAYILGTLIVVMMIAAFVVGILCHTLDVKAVLKGLGIQLLVLLGCVVFALIAYYLIGLILSICGVFSIHAITSIMFSSTPLLFFAGLTVVIFALALYGIFRRLFKVTAGDIVRGNVVLFALLGAVISFALPAASYLFAWVGLAEAFIFLMNCIFKKMYLARTGESMEKLFLYVLPVIFMLPIFFGLYLILGNIFGASAYYLITVLAVLFSGFVTPYFAGLTPKLAVAFARIPTIPTRVSRTVTERVEDSVKKGKYTNVTHKKVTREHLPYTYKLWHGIVALMCVSLIVVFSLSGKGDFSNNISGKSNMDRQFTDDAVVYVVDKTTEAPFSNYWMIADLDAYNDLAEGTAKFSWNSDTKAYVKQDSQNDEKASALLPTVSNIQSTSNTKTFTVSTRLETMRYALTFRDTSRIQEIRITSYTNDGSRSNLMRYTPTAESTITIDGMIGQCDVTVQLKSNGKYNDVVEFSGKQIAFANDIDVGDNSALRDFEGAWKDIKTYYETNAEMTSKLKAGYQVRGYDLTIAD